MTLMFQHLWEGPNGDMAIAGRRLRVYTIHGEYAMGMSAEAIAENAEIPLAAVFEALAYAAEHPKEMEAISRADDEADRRITARLPEHLRRIAEEVRAKDEEVRQELIRKGKETHRMNVPWNPEPGCRPGLPWRRTYERNLTQRSRGALG